MPTLSVADAFFLEELRAAVGHRQASIWLSSTHAKARFDCAHRGSSSSTTPSSTPLTRSPSPPVRRHLSEDDHRRSDTAAALGSPSRAKISHSWSSGRAAQTPHSPADAPAASEDDEHVKRVLRAGGRDAGLVFTDAAHCVYDVRR